MGKCLDQPENPFSTLNTRAKRQKFFKEKWEIAEPVEYVLGVRFDVSRDKTTEVYSQVPVTDTFVYIPILGSLILCSRALNYVKVSCKPNNTNKAFIKTCDGSYFKSNVLFSQKKTCSTDSTLF